MKYKLIIGILVLCVSALMLMSNAMASGWPPAWINQATLSNIDSNPSQDPENSGFGRTQVVVWEEGNTPNRDIYMAFSVLDGAPFSWSAPIPVARTDDDEINPAVAVTNIDPNGATEIHVVYQRWNPAGGGQWDVYHDYTNNFGVGWSGATCLDAAQTQNAIDPAIVYTEDVSNPNVWWFGWLVQIVWSEADPVTGLYEIQYNAHYLDPMTRPPTRRYVGTTLIHGVITGATGDCLYPEIASVDERFTLGIFEYYFAIVWQEELPLGGGVFQWNVWYVDGFTTIFPPPISITVTPGSLGQLNPGIPGGDNCYDPDIAATQDYQVNERYYFHVDYVYWNAAAGTWQIDTCYYEGASRTPGAALFTVAPAQGPVPNVLDRPTIASKLIQVGPTIFETWMAWEDSTNPAANNPDIWFSVGTCQAGGVFGYTAPSLRVGYVPGVGGGSIEYNPELWNRNDAVRMFPPLTHLVFDQDLGGGIPEAVYIDP